MLGNRALPLDDYENLPELILAAMHVSEGADVKEVIARHQDDSVKRSLAHAFGV